MLTRSPTLLKAALALSVTAALTACGGGGSTADSNPVSPSNTDQSPGNTGTGSNTKFNPAAGANVAIQGTVATGSPLPGTPVTVYDSAGKVCSTSTAGSTGQYSISAKCAFPVLVVADTPELEGKSLYTIIPTITSDGQQVNANLTPITSVLAQLVLGAIPKPGTLLSRTLATSANLDAANAKIHEVLDPLTELMGSPAQDFLGGAIKVGEGQDLLMDALTITYENVPSTSQNRFYFQLMSEHRPIVLVHNTKQSIATAYVDEGLGVATNLVQKAPLVRGQAAINQLRDKFENLDFQNAFASKDAGCFLHNGSGNFTSLFEVPPGWSVASGTRMTNVRLVNFNTFTNFTNQTEERTNTGPADLAYISFDHLNAYGMKQRAYLWVVKGTQVVNGCSTTGNDWRILGNQRPVYVRTNTYALHRIQYNSSFAGRTDQYGTGTEHFIDDSGTPQQYAYALVSGPGLPANGQIFVKLNDNYLRYKGTIQNIRSAAGDNVIFDQVEDTRSVLMKDTDISKITDALYSPQNKYTIRFYSQFADLDPSLTLTDVLPKRPYLNTELPVDYFHSVGVNLDALVTALQKGTQVTVNWDLRQDLRGRQMVPYYVQFMRKTCVNPKQWPSCSQRSQQFNEYAFDGAYFNDPSIVSAVLAPLTLPLSTGKTFESNVRVELIDSLNRPIEVIVGMTYQR